MPTITKVALDPKKQTVTQKVLDFRTGLITSTVTQYWLVVWSGAQSDPTACYGAVDPKGNALPGIRAAYGGATCNRIQPMLDSASAGNVYRVQVDYSTRPAATANGSKWDISIAIDGAPVTETLYHDGAGTAIANSAGQSFQQQPSKTYFDAIYRIGFKSQILDVASIDALQGCLNSAAFTLSIPSLNFSKLFEAQSTELTRCPTSTVLTGDPSAPQFWQAEYELYYRKPITSPRDQSTVSGWTIFLLDQGYCELVSGKLQPITNPAFPAPGGLPLNSPSYLNGAGRVATTPTWLQFAPSQPTGDFTPLFAGIA